MPMSNTIELLNKNNCTGCKSCGDVCPVDAIRFYDEADGFWYPTINHDKCVKCGLCANKCPSLNSVDSLEKCVIKCYGVKAKNEEIRYNSTSGGFFSVLAEKWINDGGIVVGAEYDDSNLVFHSIAFDKKDISKLRQSKYVQSDTQGIYKKVKELLDNKRKVLFCGTPCQVEALLLFLVKPYDNLLTLDFVCCGICSPGIYKLYLNELEQKYKSKISKVWFKNKDEGWRSIGTRIDFENGRHYFRTGSRDLFMTSFVTDALSMRLSCEECKYRKLPHRSDIMLGDFWGIENVNPSFDDNKGVSAVLVNSEKGKAAFDSIWEYLDYFETTIENIVKGNFTIFEPKHINPLRSDFVNLMNKKGFQHAMSKYSKYSGVNKIRTDMSFYKSKLKKIIKL